jgi:hypothetical protein
LVVANVLVANLVGAAGALWMYGGAVSKAYGP